MQTLRVKLLGNMSHRAVFSHSFMSHSLRPYGLQPTRLLCSWGFFRQKYWSGLPCPPPGDLPNPGIEPRSPTLQTDSSPSELPGKPNISYWFIQIILYFIQCPSCQLNNIGKVLYPLLFQLSTRRSFFQMYLQVI